MRAGGTINATTSTNWSGLVGFWSGIEGASAHWTVPPVASSTSSLSSATWVGVDGVSNDDLIQTGTSQDTTLGYYAWLEILPASETVITNSQGDPALVEPGDQIVASVAEVQYGIWTIYLDDATQDWYFAQNYYYYGPATSAEWIEEAPTVNGSVAPLANFGTVDFSETGLYGDYGSAGTSWYGTNMTADNEIEMLNVAGTIVLASPSAPTSDPSGGQDFSDTYEDTPVPPPLPAAPTNFVATPHNEAVTLSWNASDTYGGPAVTSYTATVGTKTCVTAGLTCTVTGLTNGDTYPATVYATSPAGQGHPIGPIEALAAAPPSAPSVLSVLPGPEDATVTLSPPVNNGGATVTSYTYYWSSGGVVHNFGSSVSTALTLAGLPNGATISFFATATNVSGTSAPSTAVAKKLPLLANPPTNVVAIGGATRVAVKWTKGLPGAAVSSYTAYVSTVSGVTLGASVCSTTKATECTITGLSVKTTYFVMVSSNNSVGSNDSVTVQTATAKVPVGAPGVVTGLKAKAATTSISLTWKAPKKVGNGVGNYLVEEFEAGAWVTVATPVLSKVTVSSLVATTKYKFQIVVYAINGQLSKAVTTSVTTL